MWLLGTTKLIVALGADCAHRDPRTATLGIFFFLPFLFWTLFLIAQKSSLNQTSSPTPKLVCNFISSNTNISADPQNEGGAFFNFQNHPKFTPQMANF